MHHTHQIIKKIETIHSNCCRFYFGNNSSGEKISMTSPVIIKTHNNYEMGFIMPKNII